MARRKKTHKRSSTVYCVEKEYQDGQCTDTMIIACFTRKSAAKRIAAANANMSVRTKRLHHYR